MKHFDQLCRGAFFFATLPPGLRCRFADNEATRLRVADALGFAGERV